MFTYGSFDALQPVIGSLKSGGSMVASLPHRLSRLLPSREGQAMAEYAVILVLVSVVVVVVLIVLGNQVRNVFSNISGALPRGPG